MAIANFDEIIRGILGLNKPPPDDAQPFVPQPNPYPTIAEGEMAPMNDYDVQRQEMLGNPQILPYVPGNYPADDAGPGIIPNNSPVQDFKRGPNVPLRRGNAKYGSGIDI
jgi:hypothetical protein